MTSFANPKSTVSLLPSILWECSLTYYDVSGNAYGSSSDPSPWSWIDPIYYGCWAIIYALMKQLQWEHLEDIGEDRYIVFQRGLHLEIEMMKMLG